MLHPDSLFQKYKDSIARLTDTEKCSILNDTFELYGDAALHIYYAPHNEYINNNARIIIVGITPGWTQTQRAYQIAQKYLKMGVSDEEVCFQCKSVSRFAGTMRKNLISMLDELGLHQIAGLSSCAKLFDTDNDLLHTTSLIKYPCFYKGKNYSGHTPRIISSAILTEYIDKVFRDELECMDRARLIIPLGSAVESAFHEILNSTAIRNYEVLWGFPHPSGLNAHRADQFQANRNHMLVILKKLEDAI